MKIQFQLRLMSRIESVFLYIRDIRRSKCEIDGKILLSFQIGFVSVKAGRVRRFWDHVNPIFRNLQFNLNFQEHFSNSYLI